MNIDRVKVSPVSTDFRTEGDFQLILNLLSRGPYQIPNHLRQKVIQSIDRALDSDDEKVRLLAGRLLEKFETINLKIAQAAVPHKHEHFNPTEFTDTQLVEMIQKAKHLIPELKDDG